MSRALVIVNKTLAGEDYASTYCVQIGTPEDAVTAADLTTWGAASTVTTATTAAAAPTNIIQSIVSFERWMSDPAVNINRVYITDGKRNALTDPDSFATVDCSVPGSFRASSGTLAPGAICLVIARVPFGFSQRPGRLFMRGVITTTEVQVTGAKLISLTAGALTAYQTGLTTALTNSKLNTYFAAGTNVANGILCIPHFSYTRAVHPKPTTDGQLIGSMPIANLLVKNAAVRQVKRGRKEH